MLLTDPMMSAHLRKCSEARCFLVQSSSLHLFYGDRLLGHAQIGLDLLELHRRVQQVAMEIEVGYILTFEWPPRSQAQHRYLVLRLMGQPITLPVSI